MLLSSYSWTIWKREDRVWPTPFRNVGRGDRRVTFGSEEEGWREEKKPAPLHQVCKSKPISVMRKQHYEKPMVILMQVATLPPPISSIASSPLIWGMRFLRFSPDAEVLDYVPLFCRQPPVPTIQNQTLIHIRLPLGQVGIFLFTFPLARENTHFKQVASANLVQGHLQRMHMHTNTYRHADVLTSLQRALAEQEAWTASSVESSQSALRHKPSSLQFASSGSCLAARSLQWSY